MAAKSGVLGAEILHRYIGKVQTQQFGEVSMTSKARSFP